MCNNGAQTPSSSRTGGILVIHLKEGEAIIRKKHDKNQQNAKTMIMTFEKYV
jgi:hypothetical protein